MNRNSYCRNFILLLWIKALLLTSSWALAETTTAIEVQNAQLLFRSSSKPYTPQTLLTQGSVVRFPPLVTEKLVYRANGTINMYESRKAWHQLIRDLRTTNPRLAKALRPRKINGTLHYPVKIELASNENYDLEKDEAIGYLPLKALSKAGSFRAVALDVDEPETAQPDTEEVNSNPAPNTTSEALSSGFFPGQTTTEAETEEPVLAEEESVGFSETTTDDASGFFPTAPEPTTPAATTETPEETTTAVTTSVRPQTRPQTLAAKADKPITTPRDFLNTIMNCNNTIYRRSRFFQNSCLKNLTLQQKVELVMSDVLKINQMRPAFKLDPRMSACMVYRESNFSPNAKGGTPDWGMYQVIDSTGRHILRRHPPVVPGFKGLTWYQYRTKMLGSTLAQADLHHGVVYSKAEASSGDLNAMNAAMSGSASRVSSSVVQRIARRYNGSGPRAQRYGRAIRNCYNCIVNVSTKRGSVTKPNGLKSCLNRAKH